jgi:UDP-glucose 4-epimerase
MSSTKKKILLAGGSGYLGSFLGNILADDFTVCSTSGSGKAPFIHLDLLQPSTYQNILREGPFDCVLILASSMQGLGTMAFKKEYLGLDTSGLPAFLQFLSDNKLSEKIIYTSSMTVYGTANAVPVKEEGKLEPLSTYGLGKVLGEKIFQHYCRFAAAKGAVLRIPGIYGGSRTSGFVFSTAKKCRSNETISIDKSSAGYWETMHIADLSMAIRDFLLSYDWAMDFDVFNIGYGTSTEIVACAAAIKEFLGSGSEIIQKGNAFTDLYLDNSKIKKYISIENNYRSSLEKYVKSIPA